MTDKRDRRTLKTPPDGVARQLAPEKYERAASENWEGDTGQVPTYTNADEDTPVGVEARAAMAQIQLAEDETAAEMRLRHRAKKTLETTQQIKETVETTHVGIDTLRFETKKKLDDVNTRISLEVASVKTEIAGVHTKLDANTAITKIVADQLPVLQKTVLDALSTDRRLVREEDHWRTKQTLEVTTHEQKTQIDDKAKGKQWWREISLKAVGGAVALVTSGAVISWLVTQC
jgi:hypothetical protein